MAEQYKDSTVIPKPNRFLVTEEQTGLGDGSDYSSSGQGITQTLVIERESTVPTPNTTEENLITGNEELMERLRELFPELGLDIDKLGIIIREYSELKSTIEQTQESIRLLVSETSETDILGAGGLDGLLEKFSKMSAEIELLKGSIQLVVNDTEYQSIETSIAGFTETFRENVTLIAEDLRHTTAEINILRSKIELKVGEVDAEGIYTNADNDDRTSSWSNTVGVYDGVLQGFEYTDASGWTGTGDTSTPYGLRFNGNQYLTIVNQMADDTIYDQAFTIEAILTLRSAYQQKLTNIGSGMYLSDHIGLPTFYMNIGTKEISFKGDNALPVGSPVHVMYLFDVQLRTIQLYLNGTAYGGTVTWKADETAAMPTTVTVGEGLKADLYNFRIYSRILSPAEIATNYTESMTGIGYARDGLIVNLDGRKAQSLAKAIDNNRAEIKVMKDSIVSKVSREEMDTAIATSSGYVIIFGNENQTFAAEHDGSVTETTIVESGIDVFKGATRIAAVIGPPVLKNHLGGVMSYGTMEIIDPTAEAPGKFTWTIPAGTNIAADYGWVELDFDMSGVGLVKKITWSKAKRGLTGPQGSANYKVDVLSSSGTVFLNGEINSILYVRIYYGDTEVTDEITEDRCIWTRASANEISDQEWNTQHSTGSKSIYIDINDVYERATFKCELIDA